MSADMEEGDQNGSGLKLPNGQTDCPDKVHMFCSAFKDPGYRAQLS